MFEICDKCGGSVKAYWLLRNKYTQKVLFFCNHHFNIYKQELNKQGFTAKHHRLFKTL